VQEALTNAAKYAKARNVHVSLRVEGECVRVQVSDDGIGFDPAAVDPTRLGIREGVVRRMSLAGGRAEVVSRPGRGTAVVLEWSRS